MPFSRLLSFLLMPLLTYAAQMPLPDLRTEGTTGGTFFYVRNTSSQPLTAYYLELVGYPGSQFVQVQDEVAAEPIAPGAERRLFSPSMTPGAAPDYMKMRAAIYADGSSSGDPEKVQQVIEHRRVILETTRELIRRVEKAQSAGTARSTLVDELRQSAGPVSTPARRDRFRPASINQIDRRQLIEATAARIDTKSLDSVLGELRTAERALAASKPTL